LGADKFLNEGVTLPEGALEMLSTDFDAILAGAFGDPRVPSNKHAGRHSLGMRRGLDLYINLRQCDCFTTVSRHSQIAKPDEIDFVVFREKH
jgi:3-isopropylmalate dehydrogenase